MSSNAKTSKKQARSAADLARSTGSAVAVAAFQRSGAGSHGKHGVSANRSSRRTARVSLRRGDW